MLSAIRAHAGREDEATDDPEELEKRDAALSRDLSEEGEDRPRVTVSHSPSRRSVAGAPHMRFSVIDGTDRTSLLDWEELPGGRPSGAVSLTFRNCDANQDGMLSRSEFTSAILMLCRSSPGGDTWYDDLTTEELDAEFDVALQSRHTDELVTVEQFERWLPSFHNGYLRDRRILSKLGIDIKATTVVLRELPSDEHMAAVVQALGMRCPKLEHLTLRGVVSAESIKLLAGSCGHRLRCLDLSSSSVDDDALAELSEGCTALRVLRLVCCAQVGPAGITEISELAKTDCQCLAQLVVSSNVSAEVRTALAELPSSCRCTFVDSVDAGASVGEELLAAPQVSPPPTEEEAAPQQSANGASPAEVQIDVIGETSMIGKSGGCRCSVM